MFAFILGCLVGWFANRFKSAIIDLFSRTEKQIEEVIKSTFK